MGPETAVPERLIAILAPDEPRDFAGHRALKLALRAGHVLSASVYAAGHILDAGKAGHDEWLAAALISGLLILLLDLYESGAFLLQLRGLFLVAKLALLAGLHLADVESGWALGALVFASVVSSHAPGSVRHYLVWGRGAIRGPDSLG